MKLTAAYFYFRRDGLSLNLEFDVPGLGEVRLSKVNLSDELLERLKREADFAIRAKLGILAQDENKVGKND